MKFLEDFLAIIVKVRLKDVWIVYIAFIWMTPNLESPKIVTDSNFINWMNIMMVLRTMEL